MPYHDVQCELARQGADFAGCDPRGMNGMAHAITTSNNKEHVMTFNIVTLQPIFALIAGILILLVPRLLNYIVAIYLIVIGILGLVR